MSVAVCLPAVGDALAVHKSVVALAARGDTLAADAGDTAEGNAGEVGAAGC